MATVRPVDVYVRDPRYGGSTGTYHSPLFGRKVDAQRWAADFASGRIDPYLHGMSYDIRVKPYPPGRWRVVVLYTRPVRGEEYVPPDDPSMGWEDVEAEPPGPVVE